MRFRQRLKKLERHGDSLSVFPMQFITVVDDDYEGPFEDEY